MPDASTQTASVYPQTKATAQDWLDIALRTLVEDGVDHVRILPLAQRLGVSRSSFYWYFESREDLLSRLLQVWQEKNTRGIIAQAERPSGSIAEAVLHVFECWIDENLFDPRLDFAIREWARRSPEVKVIVQRSDDDRVDALAAMFRRHGFSREDAPVRAAIVYFMQVGYYALDIQEPLKLRIAKLRAYVRGFTGTEASNTEIRRFLRAAAAVDGRTRPGARNGARETERPSQSSG